MPLVAHVISDTNFGGAGKWLLSFLKAARAFDYAAVIPEGSALEAPLREMGAECHTVRGIAEKSLSPGAVAELRQLFARLRPDIVHSHAALSARIAGRFCGAKVVYTRHSVFTPAPSATRFPRKQISGFVNNALADAVIAISDATREYLIETGVDPRKIRVMYNGSEPVPPGVPDRARYGLSPGDFVCSIAARLETYKGIEYLLNAADLLRSHADIKFLIAGTGSDEPRLRAMKDGLSLDHVIFTGFVADIENVHRVTDLALNTSYGTETSSFSLIECMSLGIPAVASDFGGNPYIVKNGANGLIVPARDEKALAEAILSMYNDRPAYKAMGEGARRVYSERFTLPVMVNGTEDVYRELLRA